MATSITKEEIRKEIEHVPQEKLEALYYFVKDLTKHQTRKETGGTFMARMREIRLDGPPDFSRNIDLYSSGEKTID